MKSVRLAGFFEKDVYKKTFNNVKNFFDNEMIYILSSESNPAFCASPVVSDFRKTTGLHLDILQMRALAHQRISRN